MSLYPPLTACNPGTVLDVLEPETDNTEPMREGTDSTREAKKALTKSHDSSAPYATDPYSGSDHVGGRDPGGGQVGGGGGFSAHLAC